MTINQKELDKKFFRRLVREDAIGGDVLAIVGRVGQLDVHGVVRGQPDEVVRNRSRARRGSLAATEERVDLHPGSGEIYFIALCSAIQLTITHKECLSLATCDQMLE